MKRKVIKQGHNTLTITLPAKWVELNNIKAGDEVDIESKNKVLNIFKEGPNEISSVIIDIEKFNTLIPRTIHAMYKKGVDEIRLQYSDSKISSKIQKAIREETLGYEIVKQSSNFCLIKCISDPVLNEFDSILRRTFLLLISMADDSLEAIKNKDYESLRNIRFMELTNNRYVTVCRRIINKFGLPSYPNPHFIYYIIEELERIADHYKYKNGDQDCFVLHYTNLSKSAEQRPYQYYPANPHLVPGKVNSLNWQLKQILNHVLLPKFYKSFRPFLLL